MSSKLLIVGFASTKSGQAMAWPNWPVPNFWCPDLPIHPMFITLTSYTHVDNSL